ncbi:hypothetical protein AMK59_5587 [Oryctes borbonicus]|uniref:CHHC U11-48K-type domain-containing protein n=1 Tax=Oryctes borbonicus TaxID=1629725 RepID=A0A0T6B3K0_9SCAR|nr:hypothetical protein AMK59_5587 [Oryctes borbonicus]
MLLKPHQKLVRCPFDPEHLLVENRLQKHVIYCMKKYPNHVKCPYNALHCFFSKDALTEHILDCPNKTISQPWKYGDSESTIRSRIINNAPFHIEVDSSGEDWKQEYL